MIDTPDSVIEKNNRLSLMVELYSQRKTKKKEKPEETMTKAMEQERQQVDLVECEWCGKEASRLVPSIGLNVCPSCQNMRIAANNRPELTIKALEELSPGALKGRGGSGRQVVLADVAAAMGVGVEHVLEDVRGLDMAYDAERDRAAWLDRLADWIQVPESVGLIEYVQALDMAYDVEFGYAENVSEWADSFGVDLETFSQFLQGLSMAYDTERSMVAELEAAQEVSGGYIDDARALLGVGDMVGLREHLEALDHAYDFERVRVVNLEQELDTMRKAVETYTAAQGMEYGCLLEIAAHLGLTEEVPVSELVEAVATLAGVADKYQRNCDDLTRANGHQRARIMDLQQRVDRDKADTDSLLAQYRVENKRLREELDASFDRYEAEIGDKDRLVDSLQAEVQALREQVKGASCAIYRGAEHQGGAEERPGSLIINEAGQAETELEDALARACAANRDSELLTMVLAALRGDYPHLADVVEMQREA